MTSASGPYGLDPTYFDELIHRVVGNMTGFHDLDANYRDQIVRAVFEVFDNPQKGQLPTNSASRPFNELAELLNIMLSAQRQVDTGHTINSHGLPQPQESPAGDSTQIAHMHNAHMAHAAMLRLAFKLQTQIHTALQSYSIITADGPDRVVLSFRNTLLYVTGPADSPIIQLHTGDSPAETLDSNAQGLTRDGHRQLVDLAAGR